MAAELTPKAVRIAHLKAKISDYKATLLTASLQVESMKSKIQRSTDWEAEATLKLKDLMAKGLDQSLEGSGLRDDVIHARGDRVAAERNREIAQKVVRRFRTKVVVCRVRLAVAISRPF